MHCIFWSLLLMFCTVMLARLSSRCRSMHWNHAHGRHTDVSLSWEVDTERNFVDLTLVFLCVGTSARDAYRNTNNNTSFNSSNYRKLRGKRRCRDDDLRGWKLWSTKLWSSKLCEFLKIDLASLRVLCTQAWAGSYSQPLWWGERTTSTHENTKQCRAVASSFS